MPTFFGLNRASFRRKRTTPDSSNKEVSSSTTTTTSNNNNNSSKAPVKKLSKEERQKLKESNQNHSGKKKSSKEEKNYHKFSKKNSLQQEKSEIDSAKTTKPEVCEPPPKNPNEDIRNNTREKKSSNSQDHGNSINPLVSPVNKQPNVSSPTSEDEDVPKKVQKVGGFLPSNIPDREFKQSPSLDKRAVRRRRKQPCIAIHRRSQHFEENPPLVVKEVYRKSRNFEEDIENSKKARVLFCLDAYCLYVFSFLTYCFMR